jgi:hypothetical protein
MKTTAPFAGINRRTMLSGVALLAALSGPLFPVPAPAQTATELCGKLGDDGMR